MCQLQWQRALLCQLVGQRIKDQIREHHHKTLLHSHAQSYRKYQHGLLDKPPQFSFDTFIEILFLNLIAHFLSANEGCAHHAAQKMYVAFLYSLILQLPSLHVLIGKTDDFNYNFNFWTFLKIYCIVLLYLHRAWSLQCNRS